MKTRKRLHSGPVPPYRMRKTCGCKRKKRSLTSSRGGCQPVHSSEPDAPTPEAALVAPPRSLDASASRALASLAKTRCSFSATGCAAAKTNGAARGGRAAGPELTASWDHPDPKVEFRLQAGSRPRRRRPLPCGGKLLAVVPMASLRGNRTTPKTTTEVRMGCLGRALG